MPRSHPRFLSLAVHRKVITAETARAIARTQRRFRHAGMDPVPLVGEIATAFDYLPPAVVDALLKSQKVDGFPQTLDDPVPFLGERKAERIRVARVFGFLMSIAALAGYLIDGLGSAARAFTLTGGVLATVKLIWPELIDRHLRWHHRMQQWLMLIVPILTFLSAWITILASNPESALNEYFVWFMWATLLLCLSVLALLGAIAVWRHRKLWASEAYFELSRIPTRAGQSIEDVLKTGVHLLSLNPFARLVELFGRLSHRYASAAASSAWYYEPLPGRKQFQVHSFFAAKACDELMSAYREVREKHRPSAFDEERYNRVVDDCKSEAEEKGGNWRDYYRAQFERFEYASLVGYVFAKGEPLIERDLDDTVLYGESHLDIFKGRSLPSGVLRGLEFRSTVAYPVVRQNGTVRGVLIAFRNMQNGFIEEEINILKTLARDIAIALEEHGDTHAAI